MQAPAEPAAALELVTPSAPDAAASGDYEITAAYAKRRGMGQEIMLDVRFDNGDRFGFPYATLGKIALDASGVLWVVLTEGRLRIEGNNLAPIYDGLLEHSIKFIQQESERYESLADNRETFISSIDFDDGSGA